MVEIFAAALDRLFAPYNEAVIFDAAPWASNTSNPSRALDRCFKRIGPGIRLRGRRFTGRGREPFMFDLASVELIRFGTAPVTVMLVSRAQDQAGIQFNCLTQEQLELNFAYYVAPCLNPRGMMALCARVDELMRRLRRVS